MKRYASQTAVSEERSRADLERMLVRYGATGFGYFWKDGEAIVMFQFRDIPVKMKIPLPRKDDKQFWETETGRERKPNQAMLAYEQAKRQVWRAVLLMVQAKFEAVLMNAASFEHEFLAYIALPDGNTVGDWAIQQLVEHQDRLPKALPGME